MPNKIKLKTDMLEVILAHKTTLKDIISHCNLSEFYISVMETFKNENNQNPDDAEVIYRVLDLLERKYYDTHNDNDFVACEAKMERLLKSSSPYQLIIKNTNQNTVMVDISNHIEIQNSISAYDKKSDKKSKIDSCLAIIREVLSFIPGITPALSILKEVLEMLKVDDGTS